MLTTNGCVRLGTDLLNHSKGLFSNRALDKFSGCQYNCPSMFKSGRTLQIYQVKTRQRKKNKKRRGKNDGGKIRKKRKKKKGR